MGVEKRKKHVGEVVAAGGVEHGAGVATDGTSAFQVGYESESDKYDVTPLTVEQRKELGIEQYYRPFRVNKQETVTSRNVYWAGKRVFDVVCAGLALVVLSPILAVALLAIYIEDPKASPIFKQERVGMDGKIFHMLKCRSMVANAEELLSELLKDNQAASAFLFSPRCISVPRCEIPLLGYWAVYSAPESFTIGFPAFSLASSIAASNTSRGK